MSPLEKTEGITFKLVSSRNVSVFEGLPVEESANASACAHLTHVRALNQNVPDEKRLP